MVLSRQRSDSFSIDDNIIKNIGQPLGSDIRCWLFIWRGTPGLRIMYGTCSLYGEPHTDPRIPLKKMNPTLSWQTPTLSLRVPCTEHPYRTRNERVGVCNDRVGIIFLCGIWGTVWGSPGRLQVPYVIPRPGGAYLVIWPATRGPGVRWSTPQPVVKCLTTRRGNSGRLKFFIKFKFPGKVSMCYEEKETIIIKLYELFG